MAMKNNKRHDETAETIKHALYYQDCQPVFYLVLMKKQNDEEIHQNGHLNENKNNSKLHCDVSKHGTSGKSQ